MGAASSLFLERHNHINELMHTIVINDMSSFRKKIKYAETTDMMLLFLEAIYRERKEFFDFILENFDICSHVQTVYYEQCFTNSVRCSDNYYATRLLEMYDFIPLRKRAELLHVAVQANNDFITHQLILKGTDVSAFNLLRQTALDIAMEQNNVNIVCMLLYYGAYTNNLEDNLTSFVYSMICKCTEEIQTILIDYEVDFNSTCNGNTTLFFAIKNKSPLILDIIERGADVNYYDGIHNCISLAMLYDCDPKIFRVIWDKFDYDIWTVSYSKSVLIKFLQTQTHITYWADYLYIFMENETKLQLDLEHHNKSYFYLSDLLISTFYLVCVNKGIEEDIIESFVYHLLSHGAHIFTRDIDNIFIEIGVITPFLLSLLYMDLQNKVTSGYSVMYLKYTLSPRVDTFLFRTLSYYTTNFLQHTYEFLRGYYALDGNLQMQVLDYFDTEDFEVCKRVLDESVSFPSLLQLSRDAGREAICLKYNIKDTCMFYTIMKNVCLPNRIKRILLFDECVYYVS